MIKKINISKLHMKPRKLIVFPKQYNTDCNRCNYKVGSKEDGCFIFGATIKELRDGKRIIRLNDQGCSDSLGETIDMKNCDRYKDKT